MKFRDGEAEFVVDEPFVTFVHPGAVVKIAQIFYNSEIFETPDKPTRNFTAIKVSEVYSKSR
jgi:hypothetical protein